MNYKQMQDEEDARIITEHLRDYDRQHERRYARLGLMARECERRELWRHVLDTDGFPCRSFGRWIQSCCPHAASTVYAALADVKALTDIPAEAIADIRESNFDTMKSLSTAVRRNPAVLKIASQGSNAELVAYVQEKHPGQAVERVSVRKLTMTVSELEVFDEAIRKAKERGEATGQSQLVAMLSAAYLADCVLEEGYKNVATQVLQ